MKLRHSLSLVLALAASPVATGCEPDEAPPPTTPQNPPQAPAPAQDPQPAPPTPTAAADGQPREYAVGEDTDTYDDDDPAALSDFHTALDPYGSWVDDPTYGTVWAPSQGTVGADFRPYVSSGHWAYDDDWVWVSDYPWGWAPFHYGRWVLVEGRGWVWIPGRAYRGAWVTWSVDPGWDYLGWAPAPPLFVWFGGAPVVWRGPYIGPRWVYCPHQTVFAASVGAHVVVGAAAAPIAARMRVFTPAANVRLSSGPPPARFGLTAAQIPHTTGGNLARAQEFARPSTALALGAHAPVRIQPASRPAPMPANGAAVGRFGQTGARPAPMGAAGPAQTQGARVAPRSNGVGAGAAPAVVPRVSAPHPAPTFHGGTGRFGSGGHHR